MLQAPELPWQKSLTDCLVRYVEKPEGKSFIFIIDEWDANGSQSAISDFQEYSILNPDQFAEFTGFTE